MYNILFGFQIGFLFVALYYAIKIKKMDTTPNFPYKVAIATLTIMASWRIGKILNLITIEFATVSMFFITFLWMVFFINIYILIKKKNG